MRHFIYQEPNSWHCVSGPTKGPTLQTDHECHHNSGWNRWGHCIQWLYVPTIVPDMSPQNMCRSDPPRCPQWYDHSVPQFRFISNFKGLLVSKFGILRQFSGPCRHHWNSTTRTLIPSPRICFLKAEMFGSFIPQTLMERQPYAKLKEALLML